MNTDVLTTFRDRTLKSGQLAGRLRGVMPAGETRSVTYFAPYPIVIASGAGAEVVDIDGNRYIDVLNNYTSLVHGHAFRPVVEAATTAIRLGTAFPAPTHVQLALAEALCERYPAVESVRFTNSGTEASLLALRIARRATGRDRFLVFDGGYHGTAPEFVDPSPSRVSVVYNDPSAAVAIDSSVAAVFVEPFLGSGGVIPADAGFLRAVDRAAKAAGALVVLDEVQSLRNEYGGAQSATGIAPDLVTMGKIIGGGFPVGAVGGRDALMTLTAADRPGALKHSGTFNGNPITAAAGLASLAHLTRDSIDHLNDQAKAVAAGITSAAREIGVPAIVTRAGSIMHVHLVRDRGITALESVADLDWTTAPDQSLLHLALLTHGVYAAPRGMLNLSTALTPRHTEQIVEGYRNALGDIAMTRNTSAVPAHVG